MLALADQLAGRQGNRLNLGGKKHHSSTSALHAHIHNVHDVSPMHPGGFGQYRKRIMYPVHEVNLSDELGEAQQGRGKHGRIQSHQAPPSADMTSTFPSNTHLLEGTISVHHGTND